MDTHARVIPLHLHPLGFIESFTHLGAELKALLQNTGMDRSMLDSRDTYISYAQQRQLIQNGIALCKRPGLGLLVGNHIDWSYYGTVGGVVQCSPSLRAAGEAFMRYMMILQPYYGKRARGPSSYVDANGMLIYPLQCFPATAMCSESLRQFEFEFRLAVMLRLWDACGNKQVADPKVCVALDIPEPAHAQLYRELPCGELQFNAGRSHIAARVEFVIQPFRSFRKPLYDRIMEQCEVELASAKMETRFEDKVRWYLHANFNTPATLEDVAQSLGVTPRALARKLAQENTSFRQLVHDVRMEIASHHLRLSRLSVDEIAELVGFSSASSLHRAIRSWSGAPTSQVRADTERSAGTRRALRPAMRVSSSLAMSSL
jgi:AraC-like DNA-binding protein